MSRKLFAASLGVGMLLFAAAIYADGLDANYGKALPDFKLKGTAFKVLAKGSLKPGEAKDWKNVIFETNAKALLIGLGEGEGADLDMFVTDSKGGGEIGKDVLLDNVPVVEWKTGAADKNVVNIRLQNAGKAECKYVLLANW